MEKNPRKINQHGPRLVDMAAFDNHIQFCKMTLANTTSSVKVGKVGSEPFETRKGVRRGDTSLCDLFNIIIGINLTEINPQEGFIEAIRKAAYANDVDIMGRRIRISFCDVFQNTKGISNSRSS